LVAEFIVFVGIPKWMPILDDGPSRIAEFFQELLRVESPSFWSDRGHRNSLTTFLATFHLASRDLTGVDDAVVWKGSSVAVHAVPQRGALQPVLAAIFAIGLCAKVLFGLGDFSGRSIT
jgi:hypothetical protein